LETPEGCELRWAGKASAPLILGGIVSKQLAKGLKDGMPKLEALIRDNPGRFGL
ncbi:MAG TPA: SRPBCC family protein, partial [Hyphomonas sp.]|nr:SRPBCC family protein [Hyphomonas sp.]